MPARERRPGSRLRTWGIGCALVAALPLLIVSVVGVRTCAPLQSASNARAQLLDRFGPAAEFTPTADGAIAADRLARFLEVRRSLDGICGRFRTMQGKMDRVEELGESGDPSGEEIASTTGGMAKVAGSITPLIGEFFEQRNRALVEAEMGFGEYSYIFTMAYREELLDNSGPKGIFTANGHVRPEVGEAVRSMLVRQLALLDGRGNAGEVRMMLEREIEVLGTDPTRVPFASGVPGSVAASLAPYRGELGGAFCPALVEIELDLGAGPALIDALY